MKTETSTLLRKSLLASASAVVLAVSPLVPAAQAIVPNDNYTPDDIVDDAVDITGVGMFYRDDGFVCTGTLINPRAVLFAAHCVNDVSEADWGTNLPAAFSFGANALPGFISWVNGYQTNTDLAVYNINQIAWNPDSVANPGAFGFLEGDIAMATLDTPAADIPTWALLFSALPAPTQDPVTGTGYHVRLNGYGATGNGTTGASLGIDWRRKAAENMIGALASFDDRDAFLFGVDSGLTQNLYHIDFDDPNKTNPFDFNLWQDEPLDKEATTAGGDSGGPLILDAENNAITNEDLVIGVLSGGSRFFGGQVFSSYGTGSYYQPLYLFYDYIAAVNPYRYVSSVEGDGAWEDGAHWVSDVDPNYRIIDADGNVVNGVPGEASDGITGTDPTWGVVCFDPEGFSPFDECQDLATGEPVPASRQGDEGGDEPEVAAAVSDNKGRVEFAAESPIKGGFGLDFADDIAISAGLELVEEVAIKTGVDLADDTAITTGVELAEETPHAGALPDPTIENGLPGATGFVPNNVDADPLAGVYGRYFDVTLANAGTTTLSSNVVIDRLTVAGGADTQLSIGSEASLTSLIDITQMGGIIDLAAGGSLTSVGDYLLMSGMLSGNGTVNAPFVTSVGGMIAPGGTGTAGTLTIDGNLVLSSASYLLTDIVGSTNDLLAVTGDASLGGTIALGFVGSAPTFGSSYTVATVGGEMSGGFSTVTGLGDGVLFGDVSYVGNSVVVSVDAQQFTDFLPASSLTGLQASYAAALDTARLNNYDQMSTLFGIVDLMPASDLLASFDAAAPDDGILGGQAALAMGQAVAGQIGDRLDDIRNGSTGFTATASTGAIQVASVDPMAAFSMAANNAAMAASEGETTKTWDMKPGYGGFIDVDFLNGEAETGIAGREADFDGFTVAAGLDRTFDDGNTFGAFVTYAQTESDFSSTTVSNAADVDGFSLGAYGQIGLFGETFMNGYVSYGNYGLDTARSAVIGGTTFDATGSTDLTGSQWGLEFARSFAVSDSSKITPSIAVDRIDFKVDGYDESGSNIALNVQGSTINSMLYSAGADFEADVTDKVGFMFGARVVHDAGKGIGAVAGSFAAAPGSFAVVLGGPDHDKNWYTVEAGIDMALTESMTGELHVKTDLDRDDLEQTVVGGALKFKF